MSSNPPGRTAADNPKSSRARTPSSPALRDESQGDNRRVIVVGVPGDVPRALEHPAVGGGTFNVAAILAVDVESEEGEAGIDRLNEMLVAHDADAILIAGPIGMATMRRVADLALVNGCPLLAVLPTETLADHDPVVVWSGDQPLVRLADGHGGRAYPLAKRVIDVAGAAAALVLLAPVIAALAALIRLDSPGAAIFRHERVGHRGRRFKCLKLRTMRLNAEQVLRADAELYEAYRRNHYKLPDDTDPRITPLGRFLRKTSLDELPQLWNVLVGEMSIVGPRPVVEEELDHYGASRHLLLSMRPGLTGAWAVSGRQDVGYPERCSIELDYVRRASVSRDLAIMLKTAGVLFGLGR